MLCRAIFQCVSSMKIHVSLPGLFCPHKQFVIVVVSSRYWRILRAAFSFCSVEEQNITAP